MDELDSGKEILMEALLEPSVRDMIAGRIADALIRDLGADECRRILNC